MKVTKSELLRICPNYPSDRLEADVLVLNAWADPFGINTPLRMAHFIAQLAHESGQFKYLEENMNYSADRLMAVFPKYFPTKALAEQYARKPEKIASRVYANRMGNGNEASKDGWKYRGRGYIMITGRTNYSAYEQSGFCNGKLTAHPEWLCNSPGRMKSAMWFWMKSGCNTLADNDDIRTITQRINGGMNGFADRQYYLRRAKRVMFI
jgi:putative chitinase